MVAECLGRMALLSPEKVREFVPELDLFLLLSMRVVVCFKCCVHVFGVIFVRLCTVVGRVSCFALVTTKLLKFQPYKHSSLLCSAGAA